MKKPPAVALLHLPFKDVQTFCLWVNGVQVMYGTQDVPGDWNYDDLNEWFRLVWVPAQP